MRDASTQRDGSGAEFDLTQFYQVFFEEATENLDVLEQHLLEIDIESVDDETLNSVFRCAHSVKGGAATFGFADVAELTHQMETLLDKLRRHEIAPTAPMVDVLLQAADALRAQLSRHQAGANDDPIDASALVATIRALSAGKPLEMVAAPVAVSVSVAGASSAAAPAAAAACASGKRSLQLIVGPIDAPAQADQLVEMFNDMVDLGTIQERPGAGSSATMRRFKLVTESSDEDLLDLFTFHVSREQIDLKPWADDAAPVVAAPAAADKASDGYGFFDNAPGAPSAAAVAVIAPEEFMAAPATAHPQPEQITVPAAAPAKARAAAAPLALEAATLRVSVDKVDQLINLVGELVITQAMLAQTSAKADPALFQQIASALADLDRNTRDLQESVMSIRMIPMSIVFNRFPRMLRDLATKLDKKVDFVTVGEATELDKGLVEKITDPLTHLVRN
ncbi:hypothetical protein BH09PSE5_BH09PSE5_27210 [soil metagenome]